MHLTIVLKNKLRLNPGFFNYYGTTILNPNTHFNAHIQRADFTMRTTQTIDRNGLLKPVIYSIINDNSSLVFRERTS